MVISKLDLYPKYYEIHTKRNKNSFTLTIIFKTVYKRYEVDENCLSKNQVKPFVKVVQCQ